MLVYAIEEPGQEVKDFPVLGKNSITLGTPKSCSEAVIPIVSFKGEDGQPESPYVRVKEVDESFVIFSNQDSQGEDRALVFVNLPKEYEIESDRGVLEVLDEGSYTREEGQGSRLMVLSTVGSSFRLYKPYGRSYWYYYRSCGWVTESEPERVARFALEKAVAGGGEWI